MFNQRRQHTIYFAERFERPKRVEECSMFQSKCYHNEGMEKVKASEKKMKNYKDFYEEEKQ